MAVTKKTTAKSTTKKTATAKKTTTTKSVKTTTAKSGTKTVLTEISVSGNKKIKSLMAEFNKKFPYLNIWISYSYGRDQVKRGESLTGVDKEKTLASIRRKDNGGSISISGNKKIKTLEKEFDTVFGLYCQICYADKNGKRFYTSGSDDEKTLASFNSECEKKGCQKGLWK